MALFVMNHAMTIFNWLLLFPPSSVLARLVKKTKTPFIRIYNLNQIVSFVQITKSKPIRSLIFCAFFDVKGLCWPLYNPHINCKAIAEVLWTVNNNHDTTKLLKKQKKIWRKCKKIGEVKNEGNCWRSKPIYSLKPVIGHK